MTGDQFNGLFEGFAILFILNHCLALYRHKEVKGVSILSSFFFLSWSIFNALYFYQSAGLPWSWVASCFVLVAQVIWCSMAIYYTKIYKRLSGNWLYLRKDVFDGDDYPSSALFCAGELRDRRHTVTGSYCVFNLLFTRVAIKRGRYDTISKSRKSDISFSKLKKVVLVPVDKL